MPWNILAKARIGQRIGIAVFAVLFAALLACFGLLVWQEKVRMDRHIRASAEASIDILQEMHSQAMLGRETLDHGDRLMTAFGATLANLSNFSHGTSLWMVEGPKVRDYLRARNVETEEPRDAIDGLALASGRVQERRLSDGTYRLVRPVVLGRGDASDPRCIACHAGEMNMVEGDVLGAFSASIDTNAMPHLFDRLWPAALTTMVVTSVVTVFLIVLLRGVVTVPLQAVSERMNALSKGDTDSPIPDFSRVDEIGDLRNNLDHFCEVVAAQRDSERNLRALNDSLDRRVAAQTNSLRAEITQRQATEEALRESKNRLRLMLDNILEAIVVVRPDFTIDSTNAATEKIFGYRHSELVGKNLGKILPAADDENNSLNSCPIINRNTCGGNCGPCEVYGVSKDGTQIPLEVAFGKVDVGDSAMLVGTLRDIRSRLEIEKEKQLLDKQMLQYQKVEAIGTLAGGVAHDVNNTLVPIISITEIALEDTPSGSEEAEDLEIVLSAARRIKDLVGQILAFSRQNEPQPELIDLSAALQDTLGLLRASLPSTLAIDVEVDTQVQTVKVDPTQFHQIVLNLMTNAADSVPDPGGRVMVELTDCSITDGAQAQALNINCGRYARLVVADNGCGIDDAQINRIFEPFFTTKPVGEGTGMGLSVVHGIVTAHGGAVTVSSLLGRGTKFEVLLPMAEGTIDDGIQPERQAPTAA